MDAICSVPTQAACGSSFCHNPGGPHKPWKALPAIEIPDFDTNANDPFRPPRIAAVAHPLERHRIAVDDFGPGPDFQAAARMKRERL
ncbi:MAG: hypothetical protein KGQ82_08440 [Alphaproteobacteria bacterium]|nr:hypothetical protein [Alphaproteobacteria bacterium]